MIFQFAIRFVEMLIEKKEPIFVWVIKLFFVPLQCLD